MKRIGFAKTNINPEIGVLLSGFSPLRAYQRLHSDLMMKVVIIQDKECALFITMDTIAIDSYLFKKICDVAGKYNISSDRIFASASHTHSAPVGLVNTDEGIFKGLYGLFGHYDDSFVNKMLIALEELISCSLENMHDIETVKFGEGILSGIGKERHDPNLPGDERFICWSYNTVNQQKILFYNFACHPTILNGDSDYLSADFPGEVAKLLADEYDLVCFINGSCGDISTRFTRTVGGIAQVELFGQTIAEFIRKLINESEGEKFNGLVSEQFNYCLKIKDFGSKEAAMVAFNEAKIKAEAAINLPTGERRIVESYAEGARTNLAFVENFTDLQVLNIPVNFMRINDHNFVTMPAELFSSLSNLLREKLKINFFGYCNGYSLYIADSLAYKKGFYEALSSIYQKGEGENFIDILKEDYCNWLEISAER